MDGGSFNVFTFIVNDKLGRVNIWLQKHEKYGI